MQTSEQARRTNEAKIALYGLYDIPPCPFCGEKRKLVVEPALYGDGYVCKCKECFATTTIAETPEAAIDLWTNKEFPYSIWITNKDYPYIEDHDIWENLRNWIVQSVFDEYKEALKDAYRFWDIPSKSKDMTVRADSIGYWFQSGRVTRMTSIPGEVFIKTAKKRAKYEVFFREKHLCRSCKKEKCPHCKHDIWHLWEPGNDYDICLKRKKKKEVA